MNPPSHLLINATLNRLARARGAPPILRGPFLLGAVLPDIPLTLLWIGSYLYERFIQGNAAITMMDESFDRRYFTDPLWITSYNLLHSPLLLGLALALLWRFRGEGGGRRRWLFWLLAGCMVHTLLDIPVHVTDGPLLLYPIDWSLRFRSPVSYWDPRYHGAQFMVFELLLDVALLAFLFGPRLARWIASRAAPRGM